MNSVIVFPRGQLSFADKNRMTKKGIVYVEVENPSLVVHLTLGNALVSTCLTGDPIVKAAFEALGNANGLTSIADVRRYFVQMISDAIK